MRGRAPLLLTSLVGTGGVLLAACGLGDAAGGDWCRRATRADPVFAVDEVLDAEAFDAWERLEADAPEEIRDDLRTVRDVGLEFGADPERVFQDAVAVRRLVDASAEVDRFLREDCGAPMPESPGNQDAP